MGVALGHRAFSASSAEEGGLAGTSRARPSSAAWRRRLRGAPSSGARAYVAVAGRCPSSCCARRAPAPAAPSAAALAAACRYLLLPPRVSAACTPRSPASGARAALRAAHRPPRCYISAAPSPAHERPPAADLRHVRLKPFLTCAGRALSIIFLPALPTPATSGRLLAQGMACTRRPLLTLKEEG